MLCIQNKEKEARTHLYIRVEVLESSKISQYISITVYVLYIYTFTNAVTGTSAMRI